MAPRAPKQDVTPASVDSHPSEEPQTVSSPVAVPHPDPRNEERIHRMAGLAHEMKNSLVAIRTMVELLLEKDPQFELAQLVRREVVRVTDLVGQMIGQSGPGSVPHRIVPMHALLEQVLGLLKPEAQRQGVRIETHWGAGCDGVQGDPRALEQVILNLARNAIEAMPEGGVLRLETLNQPMVAQEEPVPVMSTPSMAEPALVMVFVDTGTGIPPDNMGRLFEGYFTTKSSGSGLGLPLSLGIVRQHRGFIHASSQPGKGSRFAVFLPLGSPGPAPGSV